MFRLKYVRRQADYKNGSKYSQFSVPEISKLDTRVVKLKIVK
jgi:hypothetical protein